jgi:hypothetical protein
MGILMRIARAFLTMLIMASFGIAPWLIAHTVGLPSSPSRPAEHFDLPSTWRNPENAAANCLFVQATLAKAPCSYEQLIDSLSGTDMTLEKMQQTANQLGHRASVRRLTYAQLKASSAAPIVLIETNGVGSGAFVIFVGGDDQWVEYVDGPTLRWRRVPADSFYRWWSGHALVATPAAPVLPLVAKVMLVPFILLVGLQLYLRGRCRVTCASNSSLGLVLATVVSCTIVAANPNFLLAQAPTHPTTELAKQTTAPTMIPSDVQEHLLDNANLLNHITLVWEQSKTGPLVDRMVQEGIAGPERVRLVVQGDSVAETTTPLEPETRRAVQRRIVHAENFIVTASNPPTPEIPKSGLIVKQHMTSYTREQPHGRAIEGGYLEAAGFRVRGSPRELALHVRANLLRLASRGHVLSYQPSAGARGDFLRVLVESINERTEAANEISDDEMRKQLEEAGVAPAQIEKDLQNQRRERSLPAHSMYTFLLDPNRSHAVVGIEERNPQGKLLAKTTNVDFVEVVPGQLWLPRKATISEFDPDSPANQQRALVTTDFKLIDANTSTDPAAFQIAMQEPGMYVTEIDATGARTSYEVPASPVDLDAALAKARAEGRLLPPAKRRFGLWDVLTVVGMSLTVASLVGLLIMWRRRSSRGRPTS